MGEMEITYLDGMGDSGFGAATVHTNVRAGYATECPNVGKFIVQPEIHACPWKTRSWTRS